MAQAKLAPDRAPSLSWRRAASSDFPLAMDLIPDSNGVAELGERNALGAWRKLARSAAFQSAVVEANQETARGRMFGFGSSVFVTPEFADGEISKLKYGLNHRVLASVGKSNSTILELAQLKEANARGELNLAILSGATKEHLSSELAEQLLTYLSLAFIECHAGFNLSRIVVEIRDANFREQLTRMGLWKIFDYQDEGKRSVRGLAVLEKDTALSVPGSLQSILFHYQHPRLRLTVAEQELMRRAFAGRPDREVAHELGVSLETLKRRWTGLFRKCHFLVPELKAPRDMANDESVRGAQKRHFLIDYVRAHPEELRPYDWNAASAR